MQQKLRASDYEMIFPLENGKTLLVNGLYGAYDIVDKSDAELITTPACLSEPVLQRLKDRGHITHFTSEEERENARIISRMYWLIPYQGMLDIVLLPTYNCNFRCEYCFERKRLDKGREWLEKAISPQMIEAVFSQIRAYMSNGVKLRHVILYGGEPLLYKNAQAIQKICDYCSELGIPLICVTNGYELDKFIDIIAAHKFDFLQITVDGVGPVHDARRYLAGGRGSYEKIMSNISLALERDIPIHLRINVNRANLTSAMELPNEFRMRGFTDNAHFSYYFKATTACFEDEPQNAVTDEELFNALSACNECSEAPNFDVRHSRVYNDMASRVMRALKLDSYPALSPAHCGAESNMLVVDPEGVLYTCWDVVSMEEYAVGYTDIDAGRFLFNFDFPKWRTRTVDQMKDCFGCPMLMNCGGGCAIESQNTYGDMSRGFCGSVREAYNYVAPRICTRQYQKTGREELSFSLYELFTSIDETQRQILLTTVSQREAYEILTKKLAKSSRLFG